MANQLDLQILADGCRNAVVKITGVLDSGDVLFQPIFGLSDFINNDRGLVLTGFRIDHLDWSCSTGLQLNLSWSSTVPKLIASLAGQREMEFKNAGGLNPDTTLVGYNGGVNASTLGLAVPGTLGNFTVVIKMTKKYRR